MMDSLGTFIVVQAFLFYLRGIYSEHVFIGFLSLNVCYQFVKK